MLIRTALVNQDFMMMDMKNASLAPLNVQNVVAQLIIVKLVLILIELMTQIVIVKMGILNKV